MWKLDTTLPKAESQSNSSLYKVRLLGLGNEMHSTSVWFNEANCSRVCGRPQSTHHKLTQFECLIRSCFHTGKTKEFLTPNSMVLENFPVKWCMQVACATQIFLRGKSICFVLSCAWTMDRGKSHCLSFIWGWLFNEKPEKLLHKFLKYGYGQYSNKTVFSTCFWCKN